MQIVPTEESLVSAMDIILLFWCMCRTVSTTQLFKNHTIHTQAGSEALLSPFHIMIIFARRISYGTIKGRPPTGSVS